MESSSLDLAHLPTEPAIHFMSGTSPSSRPNGMVGIKWQRNVDCCIIHIQPFAAAIVCVGISLPSFASHGQRVVESMDLLEFLAWLQVNMETDIGQGPMYRLREDLRACYELLEDCATVKLRQRSVVSHVRGRGGAFHYAGIHIRLRVGLKA